MRETELTKIVAESIRAAGDPDVMAVATFGGDQEVPGLRVDHRDGGTSYLMINYPGRTQTTAGVVRFLDFVVYAVRRAARPEILRVETMLGAMDNPTGLQVTTAAGDVRLLRVLHTEARPVPPAPSHPRRDIGDFGCRPACRVDPAAGGW